MKKSIKSKNASINAFTHQPSIQPHNSLPSSKATYNSRMMLSKQFRLTLGQIDCDSNTTSASHHRWMLPYADFLTVVLGFFLVVASTSFKTESLTLEKNKTSNQFSAKKTVHHYKLNNNTIANNKKQTTALNKLANQINQQLPKDLLNNGIYIANQPKGLVISLKEHILFAPASATLSVAAQDKLNQLVPSLKRILKAYPHPIQVEGHTDNNPINTSQFPSNWELSTARASTIVRYLVEHKAFSPHSISAVGYAEFKPLSNNSSIEGKQNNRRVDIVILSHQDSQQMDDHETQQSR